MTAKKTPAKNAKQQQTKKIPAKSTATKAKPQAKITPKKPVMKAATKSAPKKPLTKPVVGTGKGFKPPKAKQLRAKVAKPSKAKSTPAKPAKPAKKTTRPVKTVSPKKPAVVKKTVVSKKPAATKKNAGAKKPVAEKKSTIAKKPTSAKKSLKPSSSKKSAPPVKKPVAPSFTENEIAGFRKALLALQHQLVSRVQQQLGDALPVVDKINVEEDGTDAFDRVIGLEQAGMDQAKINKVVEALRALDAGTYGLCQICGGKIATVRLKALPFAFTCVDCQNKIDNPGGERPRHVDLLD